MSELEFFLGPSCLGEGRAEEWASSQGLWLGALFSAQFCLDTTPPPCLGQQEFLPRPFVPPEGGNGGLLECGCPGLSGQHH